MNSIVTQRFIKCLKQLKSDGTVRSMRQFALSVDYLPQSLSEILKERRDVTIELLRKAIETYKFNPIYIYTGEGPLFMRQQDLADLRILTVIANTKDIEQISYVPISAQSAYAGRTANPSFIKKLPFFSLPDYKYQELTHRSFDVPGNNMEPILVQGDKVVCSFLEPTLWESSIADNHVYVIVTKAGVFVERVVNFLKTDKQIELYSDNLSYNPRRVDLKDIRELWYVRAKICAFSPIRSNESTLLKEEIRELKRQIETQNVLIKQISDKFIGV